MRSPSRKTTSHSYTPSSSPPSIPPCRASKKGVLGHKSSKETTQSYQGSTSNSSAHSAIAAIHKDLLGASSVSHNGQDPSISYYRSSYSFEKPTFGFQNQSSCNTISSILISEPESSRTLQGQIICPLSHSRAEDEAQVTPPSSRAIIPTIAPTLITNPSSSLSPVDAPSFPHDPLMAILKRQLP